jgi:hypothetical protein
LFDKDGRETGDREKLESPSDVCSVVAQETHGSVFTLVRPRLLNLESIFSFRNIRREWPAPGLQQRNTSSNARFATAM